MKVLATIEVEVEVATLPEAYAVIGEAASVMEENVRKVTVLDIQVKKGHILTMPVHRSGQVVGKSTGTTDVSDTVETVARVAKAMINHRGSAK